MAKTSSDIPTNARMTSFAMRPIRLRVKWMTSLRAGQKVAAQVPIQSACDDHWDIALRDDLRRALFARLFADEP